MKLRSQRLSALIRKYGDVFNIQVLTLYELKTYK